MPRPAPWIAVVGPGRAEPREAAWAEEAGAAIADAGAILVCGGLGGVMEAACRGARSRGGTTVGLLPGSDREDANGWVLLAIPTGLGGGARGARRGRADPGRASRWRPRHRARGRGGAKARRLPAGGRLARGR